MYSLSKCFRSEANSEPCQTSKTKLFAKTVNGFSPLTIFVKRSILDVRLGFEYPSAESMPLLTF